jgi:hypothetical protein
MSTYERSIVSIIEPDYKGKIKLDEIFIEDSESKEAQDKTSNASDSGLKPSDFKTSSKAGAFVPVLFLNSMKFQEDEIQKMEMSLEYRVPTISLTIKDTDNKFANSSPIDGDVLSLYLRPPDVDNQKPIRIDFNIQSIYSNPSTKMYNIGGIMKIPEFNRELSKSFPDANSFDHLGDVCEEVGLGFASNEETTDDSMTRICGFETYENFVGDVVLTAYKDDDSFFDWYIDPYYYLCFVNVNKQFSLEDKTEDVNIHPSVPTTATQGNGDEKEGNKGSLILTNQTQLSGKNVYIEKYSLKNSAGNVWLSNGYKRYGQWLNVGESELEYQEAFTDPLTTPGAETDFILLKGRKSDGDFYKTQSKYTWLGKQAPTTEQGNVHDNYCFSKIHNHQNLQEIDKTTLEVEISGMNFYLYKYMRIPVNIYQSGNPKAADAMKGRNVAIGETNDNSQAAKDSPMAKLTGEREDDPIDPEGTPASQDQIKNEYLSGYYVIKSLTYSFKPGGPIMTRAILTRREWPIPAATKDS